MATRERVSCTHCLLVQPWIGSMHQAFYCYPSSGVVYVSKCLHIFVLLIGNACVSSICKLCAKVIGQLISISTRLILPLTDAEKLYPRILLYIYLSKVLFRNLRCKCTMPVAVTCSKRSKWLSLLHLHYRCLVASRRSSFTTRFLSAKLLAAATPAILVQAFNPWN